VLRKELLFFPFNYSKLIGISREGLGRKGRLIKELGGFGLERRLRPGFPIN